MRDVPFAPGLTPMDVEPIEIGDDTYDGDDGEDKETRIAELKDFAERQRCVYSTIRNSKKDFSVLCCKQYGKILSEGESREDWLFEELNTLLTMIEEL